MALGAAEDMGLALFHMRAYAEAIPWLSVCIDADLRVAELAAARWECRLAVGDPAAEADWARVEQTNEAPDAPDAGAPPSERAKTGEPKQPPAASCAGSCQSAWQSCETTCEAAKPAACEKCKSAYSKCMRGCFE